MSPTTTRIAFIGGGNMARSLIAGLVADGYDAARLTVSDPDTAKRKALAEQFGITACDQTAMQSMPPR